MMKYRITIFFLLISLGAFTQVKKVVADKVIATIGDKIILKSDIDNAIRDFERQNQIMPPNAECLLLEQTIAMQAMVLQAEKDSLPVSEEEIQGKLDNRIRYFISIYGSREYLEQIAGKTIYQLKEELYPKVRDQMLAEAEQNKIWSNVRITPEEVQEYFSKIPKDSLLFYESELEIGQIVLYPNPSRDVEEYVIDQLKQYKKEVEEGTKRFEILASLYSDDPGSKKQGGMIELNRNDDQWDPVFLAKAFSLKENGQVSSVFKTQFGYHIIQLVSRNGDDAVIRHILKIPEVSSIEVNATKEKLDSIRKKLIDGTLTFGEAVDRYSEDKGSKFTGGRISTQTPEGASTSLTIQELDKDLVLMLDKLKVGEYSQPVSFKDETGKTGVRILYLMSKTEPHRENLKADYDKIAARALSEKKMVELDTWLREKLPTFYVNVDPDYQHCPQMQQWVDLSTAQK